MKRDGFTLIEMLIVIMIIMILLAIAVPQFGSMVRKYNMEKETKEIYANILYARMHAMNTNTTHIVDLSSASAYTIADDKNGNDVIDGGEVMLQSGLTFPIAWDGAANQLDFDARGIPSITGIIRLTEAQNNASVDCVAISMTRVIIGKYDSSGSTCVQK